MLFNTESRKIICSGDEFSLETDDPVLRPLPDFRLLEMQWFLHRVTAMSGAAEIQDEFDDDSDDDITTRWQDQEERYTGDDNDDDDITRWLDQEERYTGDDWDMEMEAGPE
jgi:hypothetical protein